MSVNKTANYELNQWELNDKPIMDEFNEDNKKIDTALSNKVDIKAPEQLPLPISPELKAVPISYFTKDQNGRVRLMIRVMKQDDSVFSRGMMAIAVMHEGFKAKQYEVGTGHIHSGAHSTVCSYSTNEQGVIYAHFHQIQGTENVLIGSLEYNT